MPRVLTVFFSILLLFSPAAFTRLPASTLSEINVHTEFSVLRGELERARNSEPKAFITGDFDYLYGRTAQDLGDLAAAFLGYSSTIERRSELAPLAAKHLSELMRDTGNFAFERIFLNEIAYGEIRILREPAVARIAENQFESKDYLAAIKLSESGIARFETTKTGGDNRSSKLLYARSLLGAKRNSDAAGVFKSLIGAKPDDLSLEGVKGLDLVENGKSQFGIKVASLPADEHRKRADIYQVNRSFPNARLHYLALVKASENTDQKAEAMFQIGRGFEQKREYESAIKWFERVLNETPESKSAEPALYSAAGSYAALGKTDLSVENFKRFIDGYPKADNIERAYMNIIDAYRDAGNNKKALEWTASAMTRFKGDVGESVALFAAVRIHLAEKNWKSALDALVRLESMKDLGGTTIAGGTNRNEVRFLKAVVLEKLGRKDDAVALLNSFRSGSDEYFRWRAVERIKSLENSGKDTSDIKVEKSNPENSDSLFGDDSFGSIGNKLLKLGLYDEAGPIIEDRLRGSSNGENGLSDFEDTTSRKLASIYSKGGFADRSMRYAEPRIKKLGAGDEMARILYPVPFRAELLRHSAKYKIDPRFLLSIMRQESRFQADVKSNAAARGLMQFIAVTSRQIAGELQFDDFKQDDLYDPDTAIRFGSHYISNIFRDFPSKPQAVAASYNGGEDRMARWLKRANSDDPDIYVSEIVFTQSKDYVYKVMANFHQYQKLYDSNLVPN